MVLAPNLPAFGRRFPYIVLEVTTTQEGRTELVAAGFDAGIHLGELTLAPLAPRAGSGCPASAASPAYCFGSNFIATPFMQ